MLKNKLVVFMSLVIGEAKSLYSNSVIKDQDDLTQTTLNKIAFFECYVGDR